MPKKKNPGSEKDRHKPRRMVGVKGIFVDAGEELADRLGITFAAAVNQAFREMLERHQLWPPKSDTDA